MNVETTTTVGEHDRLINTKLVKPITLRNRFSVFQLEAESGDEEHDETNDESKGKEHMPNWTNSSDENEHVPKWNKVTRHKPNNRQPKRQKELQRVARTHNSCSRFEDDEKVRDAAASQHIHEKRAEQVKIVKSS